MSYKFANMIGIGHGFGRRSSRRWLLREIGKLHSVTRHRLRLSDPVVLMIGAMLGLVLCLTMFRDFIFTPGLPSWQDLTWPYSSHVFPHYYLWDEFRQAPVMPNHMVGYLFFYLFSAEASIRLLYIFLFTMMGMCMFYATFKLTATRHPTSRVPLLVSLVATVVYVINPVICRNWTIWYILWFYAFMPLLFYLTYAALTKINSLKWLDIFKKAIVIALVLLLMSPGGERFVHYVPLLFLAFFAGFSRPFLAYLKRTIVIGGVILVLYIIFCSIWLLPFSMGALNPSEFTTFSRNWVYVNSGKSNLILSMNLMVTQNTYNGGCFRIAEPLFPFRDVALLLLPSLAFCALLLRRSKLIVWLVLFAFMFIFLAKGTNPPFGRFYEWLACDAPVISSIGMALRRANYWVIPLIFCYTVLYSLTLSHLLRWISAKLKWSIVKKALFVMVFIIFLATPFFTGLPLLTGDINGTFRAWQLQSHYISLNRWLEEDDANFKVYYYPESFWFGSGKPTLPVGSRLEGSHATLGYGLIRRSIEDTLRFGELISPWNIRYVIVNSYTTPEALSRFEAQKDLALANQFEALYVYENLANHSQIEASTQAVAVQGGLENLLSLTTIDSYKTLSQPAIFLDQEIVSSECLPGADIVVSNQANLDLYMTLLEENYMVKPFEAVDHDISMDWIKARARPIQAAEWTLHLDSAKIENWQHDYDMGFARANGGTLNMSFEVSAAGDYDIFMRCLKSWAGGALRVLLDDETIGEVSTRSDTSEFEWVQVGTFDVDKGKHKLTLDQIVSGFNAVNLFAVLPSGEMERYERQIDDMVANKRIVSIWEAETALNYLGANVSDGYGGNASNGEVLMMQSGSRAWRQIDVVRDGQYMIAVRLAGDMLVKMDDQVMPVQSADLGFAYTAPVYLMKGVHNIEVTPNAGEIDLDVVWLYTIEKEYESVEDIFISGENAAQVVEFAKINPTKYRATVNATQPFMLSFAESYEHMWVARVNGKEYHSIPLNGVVNGFWIEDQGELEITIEYKPQKYLYYGAIISLIGVIGALSFLIWDWRKRAAVSKGSGRGSVVR